VDARAIVAACAVAVAAALPAPAHGAIALRGASGANTGSLATTPTLTIPAPSGLTAGDVMVATIAVRATTTTVTAAGWLPVPGLDTSIAAVIRQVTFYRVADSTDAAAPGFSFDLGGSRGAGGIAAYSGVDTANPVDVVGAASNSTGSTDAAPPSVTTTNLRARVIAVESWAATTSVTPAGGTTELYESASVFGPLTNNGTIEAADLTQAAPGSTPALTVTAANSARWIAQTIALNEMPELTAGFPSAYAWTGLVPGSTKTSSEQTVSVTSNRAWGLKIASDRSDGRSRQWTGAAYGSLSLANPMQWRTSSIAGSAQATSFADLSGTAATVVTGQAASAGATAVGVTYRQQVSYADEASLPAGNTYRQNVSYTAQQGF